MTDVSEREAMNSQRGFTIVELLVAAAIFLVVLTSLGALFVSSSNAYRANERVSERQQEAEAAFQLLSYELGLAGYQGTLASQPLSGIPLVITKAASSSSSDSVEVRYYEDRFVTGERRVRFGVDQANDVLYRKEDTGDEQVIVSNIANLKVVQYIRRNGLKLDATPGTAVPEDLAGLNMEVTFTDGSLWRFPVGLSNAPQATAN